MNNTRRQVARITGAVGVAVALVFPTNVPAAAEPGILLAPTRIAELRKAVADRTEPTFTARQQVKTAADAARDVAPNVPDVWYVPGYYGDAEGHKKAKEGLMRDANNAYALSLAYRITGEEPYAVKAREIVMAWSGLRKTRTEDDSTLCFSYHFPPMIFAADLLRGWAGFTPEDDRAFGDFLEKTALPMNTMSRGNNWGNWGLVLFSAIAAYQHDTNRLDQAEKRWKEFVDRQIGEDGTLSEEVGRNGGRSGLWYSHFSLFPQTLAAEILRGQGRDLFEYKSPKGRTLRLAYEKLAPWSLRPETFPYWKGDPKELRGRDYVSYFEILYPCWPLPESRTLLEALRPLSARHGLPFLTFTHGRPLDANTESAR